MRHIEGEATEDLVILFVDAVEPARATTPLHANPAHGRRYSGELRDAYRVDLERLLVARFSHEASQGDMGMARHTVRARRIGAGPDTIALLQRLVAEQAAAPGSATSLKATALAALVVDFVVAAASIGEFIGRYFVRGGWGVSNSGAEPWITWAGVLKRYPMAILDLADGGDGRIGALASPESRGTGLDEQREMIRSAQDAWSRLTLEQQRAVSAPEARAWLEDALLAAARRRWRVDAVERGFEGVGRGSTVGPTALRQFENALFRALR